MKNRALIRRVLAGDHRAAQALIEETYPAVYRMTLHLTCRREAAEDITQQSFSRAWQSLPLFRGECSFTTWVRRIAYREYLHWRRELPNDMPIGDGVHEPVELNDSTDRVALEAAISMLPEDLRVTFLLVAVEEFSVKEAAGALEIPEGTVKSRLFSARTKLRLHFDSAEAANDDQVKTRLAKEIQQ